MAAAATLALPAAGQQISPDIRTRIESAFDQLLGNTPELAIPLTRRALARRSQEAERTDGVRPLSYAETDSDEPRFTATIERADDGGENPDTARVPRPRPAGGEDTPPEATEVAAASVVEIAPMGGPLDLVAGAADPLASAQARETSVEDRTAAAEPQPNTADTDAPPAIVSADGAPVIVAAAPAAASVPADTTAGQSEGEEVIAASDAPLDMASIASSADSADGSVVVVPAIVKPDDEAGVPAIADGAPAGFLLASAPIAPLTVPVLAAAATAASPELVAQTCLTTADLHDEDGDFKRNATELAAPGLCIGEQRFKERRRDWVIETVRSDRPGPLFAVMHDDEGMSFDNAVAALKLYGGTLVSVDTGGERNLDGIDPNRNFSGEGIGCAKLGENETPQFTAAIRALFDMTQPLIALHNNTGERIPTGGHGHVAMTDVPKDMEAFPAADAEGPLAGDRALVLLASAEPARPEDEARARSLSARGVNVVIENVKEGKGDCSLSNFAYLAGHRTYLNVTVDEGDSTKQMRIVAAILGKDQQLAAQGR